MNRLAALWITFLFAAPALAGPIWTSIGFTIAPENVEAAVAAIEQLNASAVGRTRPGDISLMASVIDGASPATHVAIVSYDSVAQQEAYLEKLYASPEWKTFQGRFTKLSTPAGASRMSLLKSWGTQDATDKSWEIHAFSVSDPAAFAAALDALMADEATAKFPGQVHLSAVVAAGLTDVTHLISVGYQSEAEAEAWGDAFAKTPTWARYQKAAGEVSTRRGSFILRTMKTWSAETD